MGNKFRPSKISDTETPEEGHGEVQKEHSHTRSALEALTDGELAAEGTVGLMQTLIPRNPVDPNQDKQK